jgi:hypothetical protein
MSDANAPSPPRKPGARRELFAILAGAVLALLFLRSGLRGPATDFGDLALGAATTAVYASIDGHKIHCRGVDDAEECILGISERRSTRVALWLGNSQVHAINQLQPGQETATPIVHRRLRPRGVDFVAFSMPNASLEEHYVLFTYLRQRLSIEYLVLPVVFDDLREAQLRPELMAALVDPATFESLQQTSVGRHIEDRYGESATSDLAALDQTVQEHSEKAINGWLERNSTLWSLRPEARGRLFSNLRNVRNKAFGITAQSKRKMIPARYRDNMAALEATLEAAQTGGIAVALYVVPLRDDVETPYDAEEYADFKRDLAATADEYGIELANLEDLVPGSLWGMKGTVKGSTELELDFMHFQAPGHALLADAIGDLLEARLQEGGE